MGKIRVDSAVLEAQAGKLEQIASQLESVSGRIRQTAGGISRDISNSAQLRSKINSAAEAAGQLSGRQRTAARVLKTVSSRYVTTENGLENPWTGIGGKIGSGVGAIIGGRRGISGWWDTPIGKIFRDYWISGKAEVGKKSGDKFWGSGFTGTLISGTIAAGGKLFGMDAEASITGDILTGTVKGKKEAKWDLTKGEVKAELSGEAEGSLAKVKGKYKVGIAEREDTVSVGNGSVKGSIGATLWKGGVFAPSVYAGGKASVSVLKGETKTTIGNDDYNVHIKGKGDVLAAEAEAKAGIGKIQVTNDKGETVTAWGAEASAGAEAYVAKGEVSGGFTLFGIKVDVGLEGKAGGAGVTAGGSIHTNGVSGKIGAGLGLGAGVSVKIDWSNFSLFGKKK